MKQLSTRGLIICREREVAMANRMNKYPIILDRFRIGSLIQEWCVPGHRMGIVAHVRAFMMANLLCERRTTILILLLKGRQKGRVGGMALSVQPQNRA